MPSPWRNLRLCSHPDCKKPAEPGMRLCHKHISEVRAALKEEKRQQMETRNSINGRKPTTTEQEEFRDEFGSIEEQ